MLLQQYSLDHKSGHAHRGRGACTAWLFADGSPCRQTMQTGPLLPTPLCIHWLRCGLNLYGTQRFYPPAHGVSTCTAWLSTDRRIAFSSLFPPPSELVEVSSSVPVALVILLKRAGYTHTQNQSDGTRHKQKESTVYNRAWNQLEATRGGRGAPLMNYSQSGDNPHQGKFALCGRTFLV